MLQHAAAMPDLCASSDSLCTTLGKVTLQSAADYARHFLNCGAGYQVEFNADDPSGSPTGGEEEGNMCYRG